MFVSFIDELAFFFLFFIFTFSPSSFSFSSSFVHLFIFICEGRPTHAVFSHILSAYF